MPEEVESPAASDSWRSALSETYDKLASSGSPDPAPAPAPAATPAASAADGGKPADAPAAGDGRTRDESGRFITKPAAKEAPPPSSAKPSDAGQGAAAGATPPGAAPVAAPALRAPQSWKPAVRELVAKLPAEFHPIIEESLRRDKETSAALQQAAERERGAGEFQQAIGPYEHLLRATGAPPAQAVGNILQQYAALASGTLATKAQVLGSLVRDFLGTDEGALKALAAVIDGAGGGPAGGQGARQQQIDPRQIAAQVRAEMQRDMQRQNVESVVRDFEASDPEFKEDVMQEMTSLVAVDNQKNPGKPWTVERLKALHQRACSLNPEIAAILKQREAAKAAETSAEATRKAQAAATSVKGTPGGAPGNGAAPSDDGWGSHLRAVANKLGY